MNQQQETLLEKKDELSSQLSSLILFNDDVNTFDHIINSLVEVCRHEPEQAEQCALIAHFKGKCGVKSGAYTELKPLADEMLRRQISVQIC